jgi:hypothetical protein
MVTDTRDARIAAALERGHTSIRGEDGFRHDMMARCPTHGVASPVHMPVRQGRRVVEIVFECPTDGGLFRASLDQVFFA